MKKIIMFLAMVVAISSYVAGQQLKYNPVSGLTKVDIQNFLNESKGTGVTISADANTESEYEYDYGLLVLSKNEKAIAIFNYQCKSYVMVVHNLLTPLNGSHLYAYGQILFPSVFGGGGPSLNLEEIEKRFKISIFLLTQRSMASSLTMLTD